MDLASLAIVLATWADFSEPFMDLANALLGNPLLIGVVVFVFISFFAMMLLIPFEAMVVIWVPTCFLCMAFIPALRIVMGILIGFVIGIGLLKWVRR